ncbi:MAG: hypothetical protein KAS32_21190 [Candidatus Peribacteraceae bacterium]|nr:hypothetical protein [Candidatus Peribacteraceae bacterium]
MENKYNNKISESSSDKGGRMFNFPSDNISIRAHSLSEARRKFEQMKGAKGVKKAKNISKKEGVENG